MRFCTTYEWWSFCLRGVCYGQVIAMNACVFEDCNFVMQQMAAEAAGVARGWIGEQPCWTTRRRRRHIVHQKTEGRARSIRCGQHGRSSSRYVDDQTCWRDRATHWRRIDVIVTQLNDKTASSATGSSRCVYKCRLSGPFVLDILVTRSILRR